MRLPILKSVALLALPLATSALSVQGLIDVATTSVYTATGIDVGGIYKKLADSLQYQDAEDVRDGVVRLTDSNYEELVTLEDLTEVQEKERVWCVVVHGTKAEPLTQIFWDAHAAAANTTKLLAANGSDPLDLSHVSFARVDYVNVTEITSRWLIWKPPYMVFVSNRGQDLRFLNPRQARPDGPLLRASLASGSWKDIPVWTGKYAPGGWAAPYIAIWGHYLGKWNQLAVKIPRMGWLIISGVVSQGLLALMHRAGGKKPVKVAAAVQPVAPRGSDEAKAIAEGVRRRAAARAQGGPKAGSVGPK